MCVKATAAVVQGPGPHGKYDATVRGTDSLSVPTVNAPWTFAAYLPWRSHTCETATHTTTAVTSERTAATGGMRRCLGAQCLRDWCHWLVQAVPPGRQSWPPQSPGVHKNRKLSAPTLTLEKATARLPHLKLVHAHGIAPPVRDAQVVGELHHGCITPHDDVGVGEQPPHHPVHATTQREELRRRRLGGEGREQRAGGLPAREIPAAPRARGCQSKPRGANTDAQRCRNAATHQNASMPGRTNVSYARWPNDRLASRDTEVVSYRASTAGSTRSKRDRRHHNHAV